MTREPLPPGDLWNLYQVTSWITDRDEGIVDTLADAAQDRAVLDRGSLEGRSFGLTGLAAPRQEARKALLQRLSAGNLVATGRENGEGKSREIPRLAWRDLRFTDFPTRAECRRFGEIGIPFWTDLLFPADDVRRLWPWAEGLPARIERALESPPKPERRDLLVADDDRVTLTSALTWLAMGFDVPGDIVGRWMDADWKFRASLDGAWAQIQAAARSGALRLRGRPLDWAEDTLVEGDEVDVTSLVANDSLDVAPHQSTLWQKLPTSSEISATRTAPSHAEIALSARELWKEFPRAEACLNLPIDELERLVPASPPATVSLPIACGWVAFGFFAVSKEITCYAGHPDPQYRRRLEQGYKLIAAGAVAASLSIWGRHRTVSGETEESVRRIPPDIFRSERRTSSWVTSSLIPTFEEDIDGEVPSFTDSSYIDVTIPTVELLAAFNYRASRADPAEVESRIADPLVADGDGVAAADADPVRTASLPDLVRWLSSKVAKSPDHRPKPKAKFWEEAGQLFNCSERDFEAAWYVATESAPEWRRGGRPRKLAR